MSGPDTTIQELRQAFNESPEDFVTGYQLARKLHSKNFYREAKRIYEKCLRLEPNHVHCRLYYTDTLVLLSEYRTAVGILNDLSTEKNNSEIREIIAKRLLAHFPRIGKWAQSAHEYDQWREIRAPDDLRCPPFYLSSFGGTATLWLAASLSSHPEIVCFHGTKAIPPIQTDWDQQDVDPGKFVDSLATYARACDNKKVFGAIHGFYGTTAQSALTAYNGFFGAVIRHPVDRLFSLAKVHLGRLAGEASDVEVVEQYKALGADEDNEKSLSAVAQHKVTEIFREIIQIDYQIHRAVNKQNIFRMEDLVNDKIALKNLFRSATQNSIEISDQHIADCFKITDKNRRVSKEMRKPNWNDWPYDLQKSLNQVVDDFGPEVVSQLYEAYGYDTSFLCID